MKITVEIPEDIEKEIHNIRIYLKDHGVKISNESIVIMALWLSYKEFAGNLTGFFEPRTSTLRCPTI